MIELISWIHPGLVICLGGLLIPFIPWKRLKQAYFLLLPLAGLAILVSTSSGIFGAIPSGPAEALHKWNVPFLQYTLDIVRINKLSMLFGYVYFIAAFCMNIYALRAKNDWEHVVAMIYVGSALGAVFAGDFFTLFFCLEIMSWAPFFLILFRGTKKGKAAAIRYIVWHHFSGVCILAGILMHAHQTGSIAFVHMPWGWGGEYLGYNLMLLGFIVNAATAPFHSWLPDTYSEASPSGSVYMTAYTTKTAVFCLIVTFSGVPSSKTTDADYYRIISSRRSATWWPGSELEPTWPLTAPLPTPFVILFIRPCFIWGWDVPCWLSEPPNSVNWADCINICPLPSG